MEPDFHGIIFSGSSYKRAYPGSGVFFRSIGPYRLRTVAAQAGYRIKIIDFSESFSKQELISLIKKYVGPGTLLYGITTTFMHQKHFSMLLDPEIVQLTRQLAGPKLKVVSGGAYSARFAHPSVEWYVTGYADVSFPALLNFLAEKTLAIKSRPWQEGQLIDSNHDYPLIDTSDLTTQWLHEDFIQPYEALPIEIARGCIFRCSFCSYPLNGKKKFDYIRNVENLKSEMVRNHLEFGVTNYGFMDDTYNDSEHKMSLMHEALTSLDFKINFCGYIKPELLASWPHHVDMLADSGLEGASLGIESFNPKARQAIRKGPDLKRILNIIDKLQQAGQGKIGVHGSFIVGLPHESEPSIRSTYKWLKEHPQIFNSASFFPLHIVKSGSLAYSSDIDKNPEKYGYKTHGHSKVFSDSLIWENQYMNFDQACGLALELERDFSAFSRLGGWGPMILRNTGAFDVKHLLKERIMDKHRTQEEIDAARRRFMHGYLQRQI